MAACAISTTFAIHVQPDDLLTHVKFGSDQFRVLPFGGSKFGASHRKVHGLYSIAATAMLGAILEKFNISRV